MRRFRILIINLRLCLTSIKTLMFKPQTIICLILTTFFTSSLISFSEETKEKAKVVELATVNGNKITSADVEKAIRMRYGPQVDQMPAEQRAAAIKQVTPQMAEELISRALLLKDAKDAKVVIADDELQKTLTQVKGSLPPNIKFEDYLKTIGHDSKSFEAEVTDELSISKHVQKILETVKPPTEAEAKEYFEKNKDSFNSKESVNASHILLKVDPGSDDKKKKEKLDSIEKLRKQLVTSKGKDFGAVAKENSDCPSSAKGGDLGQFGRGQMVPEFEKAAFTQEVGAIGDIVETQFGYHLIMVTNKTKGGQKTFEDVKEEINSRIDGPKRERTMREYIAGLESKAKITRSPALAKPQATPPETKE